MSFLLPTANLTPFCALHLPRISAALPSASVPARGSPGELPGVGEDSKASDQRDQQGKVEIQALKMCLETWGNRFKSLPIVRV